MKNKLIITSLILLVILLVVGVLVYSKVDKSSNDLVQINNTQKEIIFCGHPYLAREVVIDGVNIVKRISDITEERKECDLWSTSSKTLNVNKDKDFLLKGDKVPETGVTLYYIVINTAMYAVSPQDKTIDRLDEFEGSYHYFGKLK